MQTPSIRAASVSVSGPVSAKLDAAQVVIADVELAIDLGR